MALDTIPWDIGFVFFAAGCIVGGIVFSIILIPSRRRNEETVEELTKTEREFAAYREEVGRHFNKTAELVNTMTESYRSVYQHLAEGAQSLCDDRVRQAAVQFSEPKLVEQAQEPVSTTADALNETEAGETPEQAQAETATGAQAEASPDTADSAPVPVEKSTGDEAASAIESSGEPVEKPEGETTAGTPFDEDEQSGKAGADSEAAAAPQDNSSSAKSSEPR